MRLCGRRYDTGAPVCLEIERGEVRAVHPADQSAGLPWIAPGFIDLQFNGFGGREFSSASLTPETVGEIVLATGSMGVVEFCPTVTTESLDVLRHALATIAQACDRSSAIARRIPAIHLEGPYLTPQDGARGAHPKQHCRLPDWHEFQRLQEASGGRIRILTMSVEFPGSTEFVERITRSGVIVSIGHTSATPEQIKAAVHAGARMSTHLGNGSHPMLHRLRNYLWAQLAEDRLTAGLIVDGHHLPADVVKVILRAKTPERCVLVSDLSGQAGQPPGRYASPFCDIEILPDGKLVVAGQRELLAGASLPIGAGVAGVMRCAGLDLATAVRMASQQPATILGIEPGGLEPGAPADLVQFDILSGEGGPAGLKIRATFVGGERVFGEAVG